MKYFNINLCNWCPSIAGLGIEFRNSVCYTIDNKPATPLNLRVNAHFRQALSFSGLIV